MVLLDDAAPKEMAAAMAEELLLQRTIADLVLPDWDACAQSLSEVYRDVLDNRPAVYRSSGETLPWTPARRA